MTLKIAAKAAPDAELPFHLKSLESQLANMGGGWIFERCGWNGERALRVFEAFATNGRAIFTRVFHGPDLTAEAILAWARAKNAQMAKDAAEAEEQRRFDKKVKDALLRIDGPQVLHLGPRTWTYIDADAE